MHVPLGVAWIGMPYADEAPITGRTVDRHRAQDHLAVARHLVLVLKGADIGFRARRHAVARKPGTGDPLLEHRSEDGVIRTAGGRHQYRHEAARRLGIEEALVSGCIDTMHRDPGRTAALYPHCGIARVARIAVDAERDHP